LRPGLQGLRIIRLGLRNVNQDRHPLAGNKAQNKKMPGQQHPGSLVEKPEWQHSGGLVQKNRTGKPVPELKKLKRRSAVPGCLLSLMDARRPFRKTTLCGVQAALPDRIQ